MQQVRTARGGKRWARGAIAQSALPTLSRCLSGSVLRQFGETGRSAYLAAALKETGIADALGPSSSVAEALRAIFSLLRRSYRCDYVYRSAIATKLFLRCHSPMTTALLPELRVWRSKADLAMFNATSVAFEIKTELDNVDRLESQLRDYSSVFDRVFLVTHEEKLPALRPWLPAHVGILVLERSLSFRTEREATSNADSVQPEAIVDALRLDEVVEVTRRVTGGVPTSTRVGLIDECTKALTSCAPRAVHDAMVEVVKRRGRFSRESLRGVPAELVSAYLETGLSPKLWPNLTSRLTETTVHDVIDHHGQVLTVPARATI